jgi:hypothetical protein
MAPYNLIDLYQRFFKNLLSPLSVMKIEAAGFFKTLVIVTAENI